MINEDIGDFVTYNMLESLSKEGVESIKSIVDEFKLKDNSVNIYEDTDICLDGCFTKDQLIAILRILEISDAEERLLGAERAKNTKEPKDRVNEP